MFFSLVVSHFSLFCFQTLLENLLVKHGVEFGEMEKRIILANKSSEHPLWLLMAVEDIKMYPMSKERSTRVLMLPEGLQGYKGQNFPFL